MSIPNPNSHSARSGGRSPDEPHGDPLSTRSSAGRPHTVKQRRNSCCTSGSGTWLKCPSGKNARVQHGSRALLDDAHPGDHRSAGQPFLLGSIHLPDFVNSLRPLAGIFPFGPPGRCRYAATRLQPPLQSPFAGQQLGRKQPAQFQPQPACSPARMLLAERQRLTSQLPLVRLLRPTATGVICTDGFAAGLAQLLQQVPHRTIGQLKLLGDLGHRATASLTLPNGFAHCCRNGTRHHGPP
jgi:hypothetical protein